jgi:surface antigen
MKRFLTVSSCVAALGLATSACSPTTGPGEGIGTLAGVAGGALLGSTIGGGAGRVAAVAAGGLIGGFLGNRVGASIDQQSQQRAYEAQSLAVSQGQRTDWNSGSARGYVEPGPIYTGSSGTCRRYTHTIYVDGRPQAGTGTACRNPDGTWRIVS